jgi:hypothetical protein
MECNREKVLDRAEARRLAEAHVPDEIVVLSEHWQECEFGFYFATDTRSHRESAGFEDLLVGSCGVLVDRLTGEVHTLGSALDTEYWFEAYRRRLHVPNTVIVTKVFDRQRAAEALCRLQMTFAIPEGAHGVTWRIPQHYRVNDFQRAFDNLPARFENQGLIFRLREIERIERENDLVIEIEPTDHAEQSHSGDGLKAAPDA